MSSGDMRIDTRGRREQKSLDAALASRRNHMSVNQRVIERDRGMRTADVADAAHICGEVIDLSDALHRSLAVVMGA